MTAPPLSLDADQKRALNLLAAGNRDVLGVLAAVATRQRRSLEWHARARQTLSGGRSQLPYFSPVLPLCIEEARGAASFAPMGTTSWTRIWAIRRAFWATIRPRWWPP